MQRLSRPSLPADKDLNPFLSSVESLSLNHSTRPARPQVGSGLCRCLVRCPAARKFRRVELSVPCSPRPPSQHPLRQKHKGVRGVGGARCPRSPQISIRRACQSRWGSGFASEGRAGHTHRHADQRCPLPSIAALRRAHVTSFIHFGATSYRRKHSSCDRAWQVCIEFGSQCDGRGPLYCDR